MPDDWELEWYDTEDDNWTSWRTARFKQHTFQTIEDAIEYYLKTRAAEPAFFSHDIDDRLRNIRTGEIIPLTTLI